MNTFYFCGRCPLPPPTERTDVAVPQLRHGRRRERRRREFGRNAAYRQLFICWQAGSWDSPSESCFALDINLPPAWASASMRTRISRQDSRSLGGRFRPAAIFAAGRRPTKKRRRCGHAHGFAHCLCRRGWTGSTSVGGFDPPAGGGRVECRRRSRVADGTGTGQRDADAARTMRSCGTTCVCGADT